MILFGNVVSTGGIKEFKFGRLMGKTLWEWSQPVGMWMILDYHMSICECSYCKDDKMGLHLSLPHCKRWNAWRRIYLKTKNWAIYLRWSLPKKYFNKCRCSKQCKYMKSKADEANRIELEKKAKIKTELWLERWAR